MTERRAQLITTGLIVVALVATPVLWTPLAFANGESRSAVITTWLVIPVLPLVGAWIARRLPANPVGWLLLAAGCLQLFGMLHGQILVLAVQEGWAASSIAWLQWTGNLAWLPAVPLLSLVLLLFPDGHPPSPRWRAVGWVIAVGMTFGLLSLFAPGVMPGSDPPVANPIGIDGLGWLMVLGTVGLVLLAACLVAAAASLVVRWRRADALEQLQLRWVAFAAVVALLVLSISMALPAGSAVEVLGLLLALGGIPLAIGVAILRHRLYDLSLVVNRTVVYGLAMATLLAAYAAVTTVTVRFLGWDDASSALVATAVVAVLFSPARDRIQRLVGDRLLGARHDPYTALRGLSHDLAAQIAAVDVPQVLVDRVRAALRVPYVGLVAGGDAPMPAHTAGVLAPDTATVTVPLQHRGEAVGHLVVALRPPDTDLATADRAVLDAMAEQAGAAVQAARLQAQVQASTTRRVAAVEEERRRLRRDLHDGLGPTLAGIGLGLETARRRATRAGDTDATDLLTRLHDEIQGAVASIRSMAYGLWPPALDELGLAEALRRAFEPFRDTMPVELSVQGLPPGRRMPAAVEVAAFHIAVEAVSNAARHASATSCRVVVVVDGTVTVTVTDDGSGLPAGWQAGVGMTSMRERAAELGGRLATSTSPGGGTRVMATLPATAPVRTAEPGHG